jgi:ATP-binding cassette subfamily B protein
VVEEGRHADLVEMKGLYYAMWRQQVGERRPPVPATAAAKHLVTAGQA